MTLSLMGLADELKSMLEKFCFCTWVKLFPILVQTFIIVMWCLININQSKIIIFILNQSIIHTLSILFRKIKLLKLKIKLKLLQKVIKNIKPLVTHWKKLTIHYSIIWTTPNQQHNNNNSFIITTFKTCMTDRNIIISMILLELKD